MGIHDGHREKMRRRFRETGLEGFADHEALELLLYYAIPRRDTNELAHRLMDDFGSLAGVLDASAQELQQVEGVGENTAAFLKLLPELTRVYYSQKQQDLCLASTEQAGRFLLPRFIGRQEETVLLTCLDGKCRVLSCTVLHKGSLNSSEVNVRKLLTAALKHNAAAVILAHNHPGGVALPSPEDIQTTRRVAMALQAVEIVLVDHIIVADDDYVSIAQSDERFNQCLLL